MASSSEGSAYPRPDPSFDPAPRAVCRDVGDAAQAWAALAPLLAGRPRVRESRGGGGHSYLRRWERPLTARLPAAPAAVPIYSGAGDTRVLVVDLDASRGGVDAVRRDATAVGDLVGAAGGRVISDESPNAAFRTANSPPNPARATVAPIVSPSRA